MSRSLQQLTVAARQAVRAKDWAQVKVCAREIISRSRTSAEGYFLLGLFEKASNRREQSINAFSRALSLDEGRYDAAVELAGQYLRLHRYGEAVSLIEQCVTLMHNSPLYLDMAGTICTNAGVPEKGWPLYIRANELQPDVDSLQSNLAACSVYVGEIDKAKDIYRRLLEKTPDHQRNHYELSRLGTVNDSTHIDEMKAVLESTKLKPERNIYLYYALGKELEDLERWDEAFDYYKKAGDAAASVANYNVDTDIGLINKVVEVCSKDWLADVPIERVPDALGKVPVFIVGLPRTGTTLTERILSSHSEIESAGESYLMQLAIKQESGIRNNDRISPSIIEAASKKNIVRVAENYLRAISYKLGDKPMFIEKFPENFLYLGFIAKAFPEARLIHLNRNPMDACFAMYKQSFFRYAYSLDDLGPYYVAYDRLHNHWRETLGDRLVDVDYEAMVSDQEVETRKLLDKIGLEFDAACLTFEKNKAASNTASTVQIREKIHTRSVYRWKRFEEQLLPLRNYLEGAGISVE
ncbi:MAG: tetratricopeptide repeat-containing sulfotransferase family protein [Woeseiaceae bacterium]